MTDATLSSDDIFRGDVDSTMVEPRCRIIAHLGALAMLHWSEADRRFIHTSARSPKLLTTASQCTGVAYKRDAETQWSTPPMPFEHFWRTVWVAMSDGDGAIDIGWRAHFHDLANTTHARLYCRVHLCHHVNADGVGKVLDDTVSKLIHIAKSTHEGDQLRELKRITRVEFAKRCRVIRTDPPATAQRHLQQRLDICFPIDESTGFASWPRLCIERYVSGLDLENEIIYITVMGDAIAADVVFDASLNVIDALMGSRMDEIQRSRWNAVLEKVQRLVFLLCGTCGAFHGVYKDWVNRHGDVHQVLPANTAILGVLADDPTHAQTIGAAHANAATATQGQDVATKRAQMSHHRRLGNTFCDTIESTFTPLLFLSTIAPEQAMVGGYLNTASTTAKNLELARCVAAKQLGRFRRPTLASELVATKQLENKFMKSSFALLENARAWDFTPNACRTEANSALVLRCIAPAMGLTHQGLIRTAEKGPWTTWLAALRALDSGDCSTLGKAVDDTPSEQRDVYTDGTVRDYHGADELCTEVGAMDCGYEAYTAITENFGCELAFAGARREVIGKTIDG
jgi:hypothetical protein